MSLLFILLLNLLFPYQAQAATPIYDTVTTCSRAAESATSACSHDPGDSLVNSIAVIGITTQDGSATTLSALTYAGVSIIANEIGKIQYSASCWVGMYYVLSPSSSSQAVVATFSQAQNQHIMSIATYGNVNQAAPLGTAVPVDDFDTANPSEARATVSSAVGEVVVDVAGMCSTTAASFTSTTQTSRVNTGVASNHVHGMAEAAGAASVQMSWSLNESRNNGIIAVPLKPSSSRRAALPLGLN
jgi:hypothetical protein